MVRGGRGRPEAGMVSAELAVSLVTLLLVLALVLGVLRAGMHRSAAVSVAAAVAREAARGGDASRVWAELRAGLPSGTTLTMSAGSGLLRATVRVPVSSGPASWLLPEQVVVEALALSEDPG